MVSWPAWRKNLELTQPDNPVYRFLKLTGIQIAFLLRCIYVRKFLCLMEFGIPSFFKVRSVTPVEVLHPMRSMCYSRCTCKVLRTWVCTVQYGNFGLEVSYFGSQNKFRLLELTNGTAFWWRSWSPTIVTLNFWITNYMDSSVHKVLRETWMKKAEWKHTHLFSKF